MQPVPELGILLRSGENEVGVAVGGVPTGQTAGRYVDFKRYRITVREEEARASPTPAATPARTATPPPAPPPGLPAAPPVVATPQPAPSEEAFALAVGRAVCAYEPNQQGTAYDTWVDVAGTAAGPVGAILYAVSGGAAIEDVRNVRCGG